MVSKNTGGNAPGTFFVLVKMGRWLTNNTHVMVVHTCIGGGLLYKKCFYCMAMNSCRDHESDAVEKSKIF